MIDKFRGKYRFLSNFQLSPITVDGVNYATVEHAYQAQKTLDPTLRAMVAELATPLEAKNWGRNFHRENWRDISLRVMYDLIFLKFVNNPKLLELLLATGDEELVEGNTWGDVFWGKCEDIGENHLGKILMRVRQELGANYVEPRIGSNDTDVG
jgi:ribA/ribD-fused uncharacterized protein